MAVGDPVFEFALAAVKRTRVAASVLVSTGTKEAFDRLRRRQPRCDVHVILKEEDQGRGAWRSELPPDLGNRF